MSFFHSRKGGSKKIKADLTEDFRHPDRSPAHYFFPPEGLELTGDTLRSLLKDFCNSERPLLYLYLPKQEGEEEARDFKVHKLERNTLSILDLSPDGEAVSFMREYSTVRFGFEHGNRSFVFETRALGKTQDEILLVEKPGTIYQERRKHRRYQLWPEHQAFLGWMQVHDISWSGMRILSDTFLQSGDVLENALLTLPSVETVDTGDPLFPGAKIPIPRAVVSYRLTREICYYYGLYFDREWPEDQSQKLADFLQALHKRFLSSNQGSAFQATSGSESSD
jgi:hypothetical protein